MADDLQILLPRFETEKGTDKATVETTLDHIESAYAALRETTESRAERSNDYGFDTGANDFGFDAGSDDIWGL